MIIMAILDFLGRLARKRAGVAQSEDGEALDGVDVLKALTGEDGRGSGAGRGAGSRDSASPRGARPGGGARGCYSGPRRWAPPAGRVPSAAPPVPIRESRVLELRDRGPARDPGSVAGAAPDGGTAVAYGFATEGSGGGGGFPERTAKAASPAGHSPVAGPPTWASDWGWGSADDLRRLVVAREVLGPPLAMRDE